MIANTTHYTLVTDRHTYCLVYARNTWSMICALPVDYVKTVITILRRPNWDTETYLMDMQLKYGRFYPVGQKRRFERSLLRNRLGGL